MTAISTRFVIPMLVLLTLALVPVARAVLAPNRVDDCADKNILLEADRIDPNSTVEEVRTGSRRSYLATGRIQPTHRRQAPLEYTITRAHGLPRRFLHPSRPISLEPDRHELVWLEVDGDRLPVHMAYQTIDRGTHFAAYFFAYENTPVTGAFWTRARMALSDMVHGTKPLTLVSVTGSAGQLYLERTEERAREWLAAAWKHHRAACAG